MRMSRGDLHKQREEGRGGPRQLGLPWGWGSPTFTVSPKVSPEGREAIGVGPATLTPTSALFTGLPGLPYSGIKSSLETKR